MRRISCVCLCVFLSGCFWAEREAKVEPRQVPVVTSDCYTVDLFTPAKVDKPDPAVPDSYRQFLGKWGGGAWNDVWCHDLLITHVDAQGHVDLFDMHAPYAPWNQPATAFRRSAQIDKDGNLRFAYDGERLSYRIVNGKLVGTRSGMLGDLHVELVRRGVPPVPQPRPYMLAAAPDAEGPAPDLPAADAPGAIVLAQATPAQARPVAMAPVAPAPPALRATTGAEATPAAGFDVTGREVTEIDFSGYTMTATEPTSAAPTLQMMPPPPRPAG